MVDEVHFMIDIETTAIHPSEGNITSVAVVPFKVSRWNTEYEFPYNFIYVRQLRNEEFGQENTLKFREDHQITEQEVRFVHNSSLKYNKKSNIINYDSGHLYKHNEIAKVTEFTLEDDFIANCDNETAYYIWAKPLLFDLFWLKEKGFKLPSVHYRNYRDVNTAIATKSRNGYDNEYIKSFTEDDIRKLLSETEREIFNTLIDEGHSLHNALYDCYCQIAYLRAYGVTETNARY